MSATRTVICLVIVPKVNYTNLLDSFSYQVALVGIQRCFNCGIHGHLLKDCPKEKAPTKCFTCGEYGHIGKDCPAGIPIINFIFLASYRKGNIKFAIIANLRITSVLPARFHHKNAAVALETFVFYTQDIEVIFHLVCLFLHSSYFSSDFLENSF